LTGLRRKGFVIACEKVAGEASIYRASPAAAQNAPTAKKGKKALHTVSKRAA
jgi:hypothetical protein